MIGRAWDRFWFGEAPLTRLAAFRILILALAMMDFIAYSGPVFSDATAVSSGGINRPWVPIYLFEMLQLQPIDTATAQWVFAIAITAAGFGIVGLFTRTACLVTLLCSLYWTGLVYSFGKAHHDKVVLAFALFALPLAPVGARLSLDSFIARYRRARVGRDPTEMPSAGAFAALPIRLTQLTAVFGYFFAGATKLVTSGADWANGYTLMGHLMGHNNEWSSFFAQSPLMSQVLGVFTLLLQVAFPLVLFLPKLRWVFLPGAVLFHWATWNTMDTGPYITLWFTLICFLPLEKIPGWIKRRPLLHLPVAAIPTAMVLYVFSLHFPPWAAVFLVPPSAALVIFLSRSSSLAVVYDGGCGMCRRGVAVLKSLDWTNSLDCHNLRDWPEVSRRFPQLDQVACTKDMHAVDRMGVSFPGYYAYRVIAWRLPLIAPLAWVGYLPPVATLGHRVYRRIADHRRVDGCGDGSGPGHALGTGEPG